MEVCCPKGSHVPSLAVVAVCVGAVEAVRVHGGEDVDAAAVQELQRPAFVVAVASHQVVDELEQQHSAKNLHRHTDAFPLLHKTGSSLRLVSDPDRRLDATSHITGTEP